MHLRESAVPGSTRHVSPLSADASPEAPETFAAGPFSSAQYFQLLTGILAQGHGIETICLFLALTRDALLDLVVQLALPTPPDRPFRRTGGVRAWGPADYSTLLTGWLGNWPTACLSERINRSRGSIWAKARRMGLPKRDRRSLAWPQEPLPVSPSTVVAAPIECTNPAPPKRLPARWFVRGTDEPLELTSQRNGREVNWAGNTQALIEMGMRWWGGQRIDKIAVDFGVSYRTITSQLQWLQVKSLPRSELTDTFDRAVAEANIRKAGYKLMFCRSDSRFPYWADRVARTRAKRDVNVGFYDVGYA
jgi:hypothetical protein